MATLGRSAYSTTRKGAGIRNIGRGVLDLATSPLGALGIDIDPNYEGGNADKWNKFSQIGDSLGKVAGGIGLGVATGGLGNLASAGLNAGIAGIQGSIQDIVPQTSMDTTGTYISKYGGKILTEYEGNTHEFGGIPIDANNEVEDKENSFDMKDGSKYIFSNSITMPNKKHTFAQGAKRIASKYKLRDGDAMAKTAQQRELEQLSQKQEFVKEIMKIPTQRMQEQFAMGGYMNKFEGGGGIPPNQPMLDKKLIEAKAVNPNIPVTGSVRFLPNGDIAPYNALKEPEYIPPTPEEIAMVMAEAQAQAKIQAQVPQKRYGGRIKYDGITGPSKIPNERYIDDIPFNTRAIASNALNMGPNPNNYLATGFNNLAMQPMKSKGIQPTSQALIKRQSSLLTPRDTKGTLDSLNSGYKPAYGIPMAGYGVQALSNLPALFAKPNKVKFDRIRPETIDLSSQRDEARRSRNLQLAMAQRQAGMASDAGQAGAYANAASSNIMGNYGDAFNQSIMQQNNTNVGIKNQAQAQNAETQMRESMVNQQELNSIREGKQQAISNMGTVVAQAGKTYGQMNQEAGMMDWLNVSNPDYGIKNEQYESVLKQWLLGNKSITPYRKKSVYGGKIRRTK